MPQSQAGVILDSITLDNIDDAMYFYSHILEKIVEKKKKFQHNEDILMNQLKKLDIKAEIKKLKRSMDSDSETSESDSESYPNR
jgi:hypothetical protein